MGKRKRKRVPEALWRLFRGSARTLADSILSLLPLHCDCLRRRARCLKCAFGDDPMGHLVRPGSDPDEYLKLMTGCYVVLPFDGASPPARDLSPARRWSLLQIVRRTVETILSRQGGHSNVICSGYEKLKDLSPIVKLLTSQTWNLVLERVGDGVISYLLMHAQVFLPLSRNKHQQVAGAPVNELVMHLPGRVSGPDLQSLAHASLQKKRKIIDGQYLFNGELPCGNSKNYAMQACKRCNVSNKQSDSSEAANIIASNGTNVEDSSVKQQSGKQATNLGKRSRLPSWKRCKKQKLLTLENANVNRASKMRNAEVDMCKKDQNCSISNLEVFSSVRPRHQDGSEPQCAQMTPQQCPCCSLFQILTKIPNDAQINRQSMFYSRENSSLLFPKKHVLTFLKPGFQGANYLLREILGLSNANINCLPKTCFHRSRVCSHASFCLYHSLIKLLKVLLIRGQRCQHTRLLDKHCSLPSLALSGSGNAGPVFQISEANAESTGCGKVGNQIDASSSPQSSYDYGLKHCKRSIEVSDNHFDLNKSYCSKHQVASFIWAVCRNIVPPDLLGAPSNWRVLRKNIYRFIQLRRFEKLSLKQCTKKLKLSQYPLLSNKYSFCWLPCNVLQYDTCSKANVLKNTAGILKQKLLERWIFWLFTHIVVPLVQANFYVTESEHGRQNLFYYRKIIWEKLSNRATMCLKSQSYCMLDDASVRNIISNRSFGFSKIRIRPKETGARPIANLKASSRICVRQKSVHDQPLGINDVQSHQRSSRVTHLKSVNCILRDMHAVLKDVKMKKPELWGASVFDYNDVYRKLCSFLSILKKRSAAMPTIFIVVSDVRKAYDTVNQDKLLAIMSEIKMKDDYILQKCCQVICRKKSLWVYDKLKLKHQGSNAGFSEATHPLPSQPCHSILIDQEHRRSIKKEELLFTLNEHVKRNVLQLGQCCFLQTVGIPQGSVLSSLLCSLYFGHMEIKVIFPFLLKDLSSDILKRDDNNNVCDTANATKDEAFSSPNYMLLRFIDDFLFITTSKKQAASFFSRLQRGFREYNCYMNKDKCSVSFDIDQRRGPAPKRLLVGDDGVKFLQWSGLLINCCTLEVRADYSGYLNNHLKATLTVSYQKPGRQLKSKMCDYMRPKCHPIFYDSAINSPSTIRLNVYQAFLLSAMKFHCYLCELSHVCTLQSRYCVSTIERSIRYMFKLMKKRMHTIKAGGSGPPALEMDKEEVTWLGLHAYVKVLNRKQSRHKDLLLLLRAKLAACESIGISADLKYAVHDSHSSLLWKIKY